MSENKEPYITNTPAAALTPLDLEAIWFEYHYELALPREARSKEINTIAALLAEVKRLREEVNELAFWDWDSPANRTPGPFVPRYPDVKYPVR
jgi:hypothetical protein